MLIAVLSVLIGSVVLDQFTKVLVVSCFDLHETAPFLPGIMQFRYEQNTGAAFSMLSDQRWVFMLFSTVAIVLMAYLLVKFFRRHWLLSVSLAAVMGGGIGNMIDRIFAGYVVDFLDVQFMDFAVFNVADIFVTCGSVALGVYIVFVEPKVERRLQEQKAAENTPEEEENGRDDCNQ